MVAVLWVVTTAARIHVWGDERLLWSEAVAHAPDKPRPWVNLGNQYARLGAPGMATYAYEQAIRSAASPMRSADEQRIGRGIAEANLARLWFEAGDLARAVTLTAAAAERSGLDSVRAYHAWLVFQQASSSPR